MPSKVTSFLAVLPLAVGFLFPGWVGAQGYPASVSQLVATAKEQVKTIDMAAFKSAFDRSDLGLIVDVREPGEYADGYIPGAVNVPRGVIELDLGIGGISRQDGHGQEDDAVLRLGRALHPGSEEPAGPWIQQRRRSGHEDRRLGEGRLPAREEVAGQGLTWRLCDGLRKAGVMPGNAGGGTAV